MALSKSLIIVTGASRGFGRAICLALVKNELYANAEYALFGRNEQALQETESLMRELNASVSISKHAIDFSVLDTLPEAVSGFLKGFSGTGTENGYNSILLFNNAGVMGKLDFMTELSLSDMRSAVDTNFVSCAYFTTAVLRHFGISKVADRKFTIVNITSLSAIQPFETWSVYGCAKAAREMFHRAIVTEHGKHARVLSWSPGEMDTEMHAKARTTMPDIPLKQFLNESMSAKRVLKPSQSAEKMVKYLVEDKYENGCRIDYWDDEAIKPF